MPPLERSDPTSAAPSLPMLDEIQRRMARHGTRVPDLFAIITWGCTASKWLARGLNSHPEILCTHDITNSLRYGLNTGTVAGGIEALQTLSMLGMGYSLAGDVHGISRMCLPSLTERFGEQFRAACVIRDPQSRLQSQLAVFEQFDHGPFWDVTYIETLPGYAAIATHISDYPRQCFVHAVNMLNAIVEEAPLAKIFRYEDLIARPDSIRELVDCIAGGCVTADEQFCTSLIAMGATNVHRARGDTQLPLAGWQLDVIGAILRPEAKRLYESFDYVLPACWS